MAKLPSLKAIGHEIAECPYCREQLLKPIRQKKQCGKCGNTIYPRKRPIDAKIVYFREDELEELEEQRAIADGTYEEYLRQKRLKEAVRAKLREKIGREPSANDIKWSMLNDDLVSTARAGHWGLYRNAKLSIAELLEAEQNYTGSLESWIEVAIFDMNGATNLGIVNDEDLKDIDEISKSFGHGAGLRPFTLELGQLLNHTIQHVQTCLEKLKLTESVFREAFNTAWSHIPAKQLLPLSQDAAWASLSQAVFDTR